MARRTRASGISKTQSTSSVATSTVSVPASSRLRFATQPTISKAPPNRTIHRPHHQRSRGDTGTARQSEGLHGGTPDLSHRLVRFPEPRDRYEIPPDRPTRREVHVGRAQLPGIVISAIDPGEHEDRGGEPDRDFCEAPDDRAWRQAFLRSLTSAHLQAAGNLPCRHERQRDACVEKDPCPLRERGRVAEAGVRACLFAGRRLGVSPCSFSRKKVTRGRIPAIRGIEVSPQAA